MFANATIPTPTHYGGVYEFEWVLDPMEAEHLRQDSESDVRSPCLSNPDGKKPQ